MFKKLKSLLVISMLVFVGACCYDEYPSGEFHSDLNPDIPVIEVIPEGNVYKIYRPEHLAWIVKETQYGNFFKGKTVRFVDDIDMGNIQFSGIPFFLGRLDGNYKKIHNLIIGYGVEFDRGLIQELGDGGHIENLTIESGRISGGIGVGSFVGSITGSVTITNIVNKADVSGNAFVGGLVGLSFYEDKTVTIDNSSNMGIVTGRSNSVGGLLGLNISTLTIKHSSNSGTVVGKNDYVGGLVGTTDLSLLIDNSSNSGDVTGIIEVGGLVGVSFTESSLLTITNSYNSGVIEGVRDVGGIIGDINGKSPTTVNITNVHSYATKIKGNDTVTGGIIGSIGNDTTLTVTNSYWLYDVDAENAVDGTGGIDKAVGTDSETVLEGTSVLDIAKFKDTTNISANFVDWDFTDVTGIWEIKTDADYPTLINSPTVAPRVAAP